MEVTLAATTTPSDVAMPASLISDLRGRGSRVGDGATKAQILVRWALQRGFVPLPRSGVSDSVQRLAIAQNALAGVEDGATWKGGQLSAQEMRSLNQLEDRLASGRLGRTDGWTADDVTGVDWDPTTYVD